MGVEPTNDAARGDQAPHQRGAVGEVGSRFVRRMLSAVAMCRQQRRDVLEYPTRCLEADRLGHAIPSLSPARQADVKVA